MKILCPHCGVKGSADDSYQGQKLKCPKCGGIFPLLATSAEVIEEVAPDIPMEESIVEAEAPIDDADLEPAAEMGALPEVDAESEIEQESGDPVAEDLADILAADGTPEDEQPLAVDGSTPVADQDDHIAWTDIVSEIDKEIAEEDRQSQGNREPASTHNFYEEFMSSVDDSAPAARGKTDEEPPAPADRGGGDGLSSGQWATVAAAGLSAGLSGGHDHEKAGGYEVEDRPYGADKEQCWQCGRKDSVGVPFIAKDGRIYCSDCIPAEHSEPQEEAVSPPGLETDGNKTAAGATEQVYAFTISGLLKEAWAKTRGAKGTVWGASAVMYLALLILFAIGAFLLPSQGGNYGEASGAEIVSDILYQMLVNAVSVIFSAGLVYIGIRKVAGDTIDWKMIFEGFSVAGKLIVAMILQTLLVLTGFILLVLPGIYLAVGYTMAVPLIVDRKMSPWQAMEASRKAVHGEWWKIFGLFIVMGIIFTVSALPLMIGLIWTWPMFVILGGLIYRSLFGIPKK